MLHVDFFFISTYNNKKKTDKNLEIYTKLEPPTNKKKIFYS